MTLFSGGVPGVHRPATGEPPTAAAASGKPVDPRGIHLLRRFGLIAVVLVVLVVVLLLVPRFKAPAPPATTLLPGSRGAPAPAPAGSVPSGGLSR